MGIRALVLACACSFIGLYGFVLHCVPAHAGTNWDGGGTNNNIDTPANWDANVLPALSGSTSNLVFAGTTRLTPTINIPINPLAIRFDATAGAFTLAGANAIAIGSSSISENGNITNENSLAQAINAPLTINRGTLNAASGDVVINSTINVGGGSNASGRSLNIDGDHDVFFNGTIQGTGTSSSSGGVISKIGAGVWHINSNSPLWAGRIGIDAGILRISAPDALGDPNSRTLVQGGTFIGNSRLELTGGVTFASERLELTGRETGFSPIHLSNSGGHNTWTDPITLSTGGGEYGIDSAADRLTVTGSVTNATGNDEVRTIRFSGAGDGEFAGALLLGNGVTGSPSTGPFAIRKDGAGKWTLSNPAASFTGDTMITGGTLAFAPGISISTSPIISLSGNSTLDLAGGNLDRLPGQSLVAAGTVNGTVNDVGGVTTPGRLNSAGTLTVGGNFNFIGGGVVNFDLASPTSVGGGVNDLVAVNGNLSFGGVTALAVNNINGSLTGGTYRLFSYGGTLTGDVANLQLATPTATRQAMSLSTATPHQVNLLVAGSAANLIWIGDGGLNSWDVNGSLNWTNGDQADAFLNLDSVAFLDVPGAPNTNVHIAQAVFPAAVTINSQSDYLFSGTGRISGGAGITKSGPGRLIVDTNNDNFGTTTINAGILQVGSGNNTGNLGTGNILNNARLVFNRSTSLTVAGVISGSGALEKTSTGTLVLLGNNTYTGTTTISAGTLQIGNGTESGSIGSSTIVNNGLLVINRRDHVVFPNLISGAGRVEKATTNNGGPMEFTALNTYTGSTTINGSRTVLIVNDLASGGVASNIGQSTSDAANLHIRTDATLRYVGPGATTDRLFTIGNAKVDASGTGPLVFSNTGAIGTSGGGRTLTLLGTNAQGNTLAAAIVDDANGVTNLVKNGDGTWVVSGNSSYTGVTTVNAGTLRVGSGNALGSTFNGTSVVGDVAGKGRLELAGGITLAAETLFMGGRQGSSAPVPHLNNVSGNNHWTGPIRLTAGGLEYTLQSDSGTLTIGGDITQTLTTLERFLNLQGAGNGVINGVISNGTGSQVQTLRKRGTGTWTLNGANTYAGSTIVEEGTLVSNSSVTSSAATTVGTGASTATLSTRHIRQASLMIAAGSRVNTLAGGATSVLGTLSIAGTPAAPTAKLDLTNSALVLDYPAAGPNPAADTRQRIIAGRGGTGLGKPWNGLGISSSTAQADVAASPNSRSIGYAVNADLPLGSLTTFRGQAVDPSSVLIRYTRTADANLDGVVNDDDVTVVGTFYAPGVSKPEWAQGDFDYNGFVDDDDVTLLGVFYNPSAAPLNPPAEPGAFSGNTTAGASGVAAVPEPASAVLFSVLAIVLSVVAMKRKR